MIAERVEDKQVLMEAEYVKSGAYHRRIIKLPFHPSRARYDLSANLLPANITGELCLDFGGGDGAFSTILANMGGEVVTFDYSETALRYAKADERLKQVRGDTDLPFADNTFDIVTLLETLEHIPDINEQHALDEIYRVLGPDGTLLLSVPSSNLKVGDKHYRHYSRKNILSKIAISGFVIEQQMGYIDPFVAYKNHPLLKHILSNNVPIVGKGTRALTYLLGWMLGCYNKSVAPSEAHGFIISAKKPNY